MPNPKRATEMKYIGLFPNQERGGTTHTKHIAGRIGGESIGLYLMRVGEMGASVRSTLMLHRALVLTVATYDVSVYLGWLDPGNSSCIQTALNIGLR